MIATPERGPGVVQFIHPGKEQVKVTPKGWCPWNAATRSDKAWPHRRKFMVNEARYEDAAGNQHAGTVGFWGEWEGPSFAQRAMPGPRGDLPQFHHIPAYYEPDSHDGLLDTDPFVFGEHFLYNGCQQHTAHNREGGAAETFLRRLPVGSLILFGSAVNKRFVLDTAFVVGDYKDYPNGVFDGIADLVPREYLDIALHPQFKGNGTVDSFRLYRSATRERPAGGMYAFTPCRPYRGQRTGFERPNIVLDGVITQILTQGKKMTPLPSVAAVREVWEEVRRQVAEAGCMFAHHVALKPKPVDLKAAKQPAKSVRKDREHRVEKVHSPEVGDYYAIRAPGKDKAYTQSLPECKNVALRAQDRVADIGSFIGEYAIRCARFPVASVRAFEPTPVSYSVLARNLEANDNATPVNAAVVSGEEKEVTLYLSRGNGTRNRVVPTKGREAITVPAVHYAEAVKDATVIKLDTEGAEWSYPITEHLGAPLRAIIIEFHPTEPEHEQQTRDIIAAIEQEGFQRVFPDSEEKFWERFVKHGKPWGAHGAWVHPER